jgi:diguanylate cyclase (GGDEF)-like protein
VDRDLIYVLLLVAIVATLLLLVAAVWSARRRGGARQAESNAAELTDAAVASRVGSVAAMAPTSSVPVDPVAPIPTLDGSELDDGPDLEALVDPVTGLGARHAWAEALRNEEHRLARYRHPTTILVGELHGLEALAERLGQDAADRLIPPVADAMRRNARSADVLTRVGHARFFALLPETDEIAAINYVERVRAACDLWLEAGAVTVRLVIGWASPPAGGTLAEALTLAQERMNGARPSRASWPVRAPGTRPTGGRRSVDEPQSGLHGSPPVPPGGSAAEGTGTPS